MNGDSNQTLSELELEITETRGSLERNLSEIGRRLQPQELKSELKEAVMERVDPNRYLGYIAGGLVALGAAMAVRGLRHRGHRPFPSARDIEYPDDSRVAREAYGCT
jgi:hypothetical protein